MHNLDVTADVLVCEQLLRASLIKMLHPRHSNKLAHLPLFSAFSDAVYSSGEARHTFMRTIVPMQDRHYCALRIQCPRRVSGVQVDLLIAFMEVSLATGPVVSIGEVKARAIVLGGRARATHYRVRGG